jgi:hypothetical protein
MKTLITTIALVFVFTISNAQSIKDYFIPESSNNKVTFFTPSKTGGRTDMTRTIYYVLKGTAYDITDAKMFNGKPSAIQTMTVEFTTNEVKMVKSVSTTMLETNKKNSYNPPRTILKMPASGQTATWTYIDIPGDNIKCTASWTTVTIDGTQKKAIKVVKQFEGFNAKTIEYYVKGIGLWKTELQGSDGKTQTSDEFDNLEYDPTAK